MSEFVSVIHEGVCPLWGAGVVIEAKYLNVSFPYTPSKSVFTGVTTCPIIENLKLPLEERDPELANFAYCDLDHCGLLNYPFEKEINLWEEGNSQ